MFNFIVQYTEAALIAKPVIYISLQEICDTHKLLLENVDTIAPDKKDKLRELLDDLVSPEIYVRVGLTVNLHNSLLNNLTRNFQIIIVFP